MQNEDTITAYANAEPKKQEQTLPGTEKALEPLAGEWNSLPSLSYWPDLSDRRDTSASCLTSRTHQA